jgi:hypothetical protein
MNRAAVIEQLKATQHVLNKLLALLQSSEADKFVAHLYQARKQYRLVCERRTKATRQLSAKLSQATKSRRAWDLMETSALGSTCCGFTNKAANWLLI